MAVGQTAPPAGMLLPLPLRAAKVERGGAWTIDAPRCDVRGKARVTAASAGATIGVATNGGADDERPRRRSLTHAHRSVTRGEFFLLPIRRPPLTPVAN